MFCYIVLSFLSWLCARYSSWATDDWVRVRIRLFVKLHVNWQTDTRGWHGNGENCNTAVTTVITAGWGYFTVIPW